MPGPSIVWSLAPYFFFAAFFVAFFAAFLVAFFGAAFLVAFFAAFFVAFLAAFFAMTVKGLRQTYHLERIHASNGCKDVPTK